MVSRLQLHSDLTAAYHNVGAPRPYNKRLLPTLIGPVVIHNCGDPECAYVGILDCWWEFGKSREKTFLYKFKPFAKGGRYERND